MFSVISGVVHISRKILPLLLVEWGAHGIQHLRHILMVNSMRHLPRMIWECWLIFS